ncbi:hypothetical protein L195_g012827 [Trifolium pratense]|uniref:Uncharacterized protein n=1 Tax=Trifolium pratense TaxID=57577 RepID=A0A2K3PLF8_TRIPR|nr:hypothetical protein L195_g012827 [Trifolium pratense]
MSFLAGRLAGKEAAYFFQESKQAVTKLAQKNNHNHNHNPISKPNATDERQHLQDHADVLPEVLKHSLPSKLFRDETVDATSSSFSKWVLPSDLKLRSSVSPDALNPLRGYVSLPQVTFGPKRSRLSRKGRTILDIFSLAGLLVPVELLPSCYVSCTNKNHTKEKVMKSWWEMPEAAHGVSASTANELRQDRFAVHVNPEKLKAASEGLANVGKAFAIATAVVFGGAAMVIGTVASKLELHNMGDLKTKGKDSVEPQLENIKNQFVPMKIWAENMSKKWHLEKKDVKQKTIVKDLSKILGAKSSSD